MVVAALLVPAAVMPDKVEADMAELDSVGLDIAELSNVMPLEAPVVRFRASAGYQ